MVHWTVRSCHSSALSKLAYTAFAAAVYRNFAGCFQRVLIDGGVHRIFTVADKDAFEEDFCAIKAEVVSHTMCHSSRAACFCSVLRASAAYSSSWVCVCTCLRICWICNDISTVSRRSLTWTQSSDCSLCLPCQLQTSSTSTKRPKVKDHPLKAM